MSSPRRLSPAELGIDHFDASGEITEVSSTFQHHAGLFFRLNTQPFITVIYNVSQFFRPSEWNLRS